MCVKTLSAWKLGKLPNGKSNITFTAPPRGKGEFLQLPCGQCIECRLERSRIWAIRCMHEASLYENNCFITLTFNDENLDSHLSLQKSSFQKFMKRLRKHLSKKDTSPAGDSIQQAKRVRYFHAGEYGEEFGRPHHHAILFNYDFPDKTFKIHRRGFNYYESETLSKLWPFGFHEITNVSFETCAYVARYVCKKINGPAADDHYSITDEQGNFHKRLPEFSTQSRRPGIGREWYEKFKHTDVWAHDKIHIRGNKFTSPPRYYANQYEITNPSDYEKIKLKRQEKLKNNPEMQWEKQDARNIIKTAQNKFLKRTIK